MASLRMFFAAILFLCFRPGVVIAQSMLSDTPLDLPEVLVVGQRTDWSAIGRKQEKLDTLSFQLLKQSSLADALSRHSQIYIKNYGPGRLATTSARGVGATQTAILWNGLDLQNPLLGQVDLSLLPLVAFDQVQIQAGGGSALWGSGAVGAVIQLNTVPEFGQGLEFDVNTGIGSFENYRIGGGLSYSTSRFLSRTKGFLYKAANDFPHQLPNGETRRLPHSAFIQAGIIQDIFLLLNDQQKIGLHFWWQKADRELPPTIQQESSEALQYDEDFRTSIDWKLFTSNLNLTARAAFLQNKLDYDDPIADIHSISKASTILSELESYLDLSTGQQLLGSIRFTHLSGISTGFANEVGQNRLALNGGYRWRHQSGHFEGNATFREELIDGSWGPFLPSFSFQIKPSEAWLIRGSINRNFRIPTFNDLYWSPGGNPDLLPEKSWAEELGITYKTLEKRLSWKYDLTGFTRMVDNWIIWLPEGNVWSPDNVQKVWSRGLEQELSGQFLFSKKRQLFLKFRYDLVWSTNQQSKSLNDRSVGKQLIYVPRHKGLAQLDLAISDWRFSLRNSITGKVYTLADNSAYLPGYLLIDLEVSRTFIINKLKGLAFFKLNNLSNKDYQVVSNYPMPGRNFEIGIQLNFKPTKS